MLLTFEALDLGQTWTSAPRVVTEDDVMEFARLTGDFDPLHVDEEYAGQSPFGRRIAHGLLGLSFAAGLCSDCPRTATAAFVAVREWRFLRPVYFGDQVHAVTEVADKRYRGRRHGLVTWTRRLINQDGEIVQEGTFETLVRTQAAVDTLQPAKV
jgi:acyl dehydratase